MKRTIATGINIWKSRGILWPAKLLAGAVRCLAEKAPRGLIVEPSQGCTGGCTGCRLPDKPAELKPEQLEAWLKASPAKPVTIHFSGKHSDPLASPEIQGLAETAGSSCSMLSVSTIGLGMKEGMEKLPVDRWIVSIPAATEESWQKLRGNNRLAEAVQNVRTLQKQSSAMVEVVLTVWRASVNDIQPFNALKQKENWHNTKVVFGRFDPDGYHFGRLENIALNSEQCPYTKENNTLALKHTPQGCPLADYLFLDAEGTLRPCPFTGSESPELSNPSKDSWKKAYQWAEHKKNREYPACRWCP